MSDSSFQEKTEAPTPRKRQEARKEGQVAKSQELTTAIMLVAAAGVVSVGGAAIGSGLVTSFRHLTTVGAAPPETIAGYEQLFREVSRSIALSVLPALAVLTATAAFVAGVQARGILTMKPLEPKFERIAPHKNIKRMYGWKPWADLGKSVLKLVVIGAVLYPIFSTALEDVADLAMKPAASLAVEIRSFSVKILLSAGLAYLIVAMADYAYQLWQHEKQLKMTKEEVKREHKDQEGDGMLKARRRSMGRERAMQRMFTAVPDADLVITNPTHVAVALRYRPDEVAAPVIVAMGERLVAQRIKELAYDAGVPVIENKPLARALLATGRVGDPIPSELYVAVAEVLAFVMRQRARAGISELA